jgi:hypothetical protein
MGILNRVREFLHNAWLIAWRQVFVGELIAVTKPRTDFRR